MVQAVFVLVITAAAPAPHLSAFAGAPNVGEPVSASADAPTGPALEAQDKDEPAGVGERDSALLATYLHTQASLGRESRAEGGLFCGIVGVGAFATLLPIASLQSDPGKTQLTTEGIVLGVGLAALGLVVGLVPSTGEKLYADFLASDFKTPASRSKSVLAASLRFETAAKEAAAGRRIVGVLGLVVGAAGVVSDIAIGNIVSSRGLSLGPNVYVLAGLSAFLIVNGLAQWIFFRTPLERAWEDYSGEVAHLRPRSTSRDGEAVIPAAP